MKYNGTVKYVKDAVRITEKFVKREFVVHTPKEQYPQVVVFEMVNDRAKELDNVNVGDEVEIDFQLRGREWTSKEGKTSVFNTLNAFKVAVTKKGEGVPQEQTSAPVQEQEPVLVPEPEADLPF